MLLYDYQGTNIYIGAPSVELLLPTLKSFTSHVKTGNFDQIYNLKNKNFSQELCSILENIVHINLQILLSWRVTFSGFTCCFKIIINL